MGQGRGPEEPDHTSENVQEPLPGSFSNDPLLESASLSKKPPEHCCHKQTVLLRKVSRTHLLAVIAALMVIVAVLAALLAVLNGSQPNSLCGQIEGVKGTAAADGKDGEVLPPCDEAWIWYRNKCYYFSEAEGTWTKANDSCAALDSSLAMIDTQEELSFMMRYKGPADHWIGLRRDSTEQPWKWVDGTVFNKSFTVEDFSECAYLNQKTVRSAGCGRIRHWTCTKVAVYERKRKKRTLNNMQLFY